MQHSPIMSIKTNAFEMDYFFFGNGDCPFVIIPGVSMKSVMLSAGSIARAFSDFAAQYTVYVFDRKKNIQDGYSVPDMAEDTATAMKEIGIQDADIFGASQGGMIAQCIAVNHPELVHALFLGSTLSRQNEWSIRTFDGWMELAKGNDVKALNHDINTKVYSPEFYSKFAAVFENLESDGSPEEMDRFFVLAKACREFNIYDQLDQIRCPVYVVGSKRDCVLSGQASKELAEKIGCPLYMYDGYSHAVYDEAPDYRSRIMDALQGKSFWL